MAGGEINQPFEVESLIHEGVEGKESGGHILILKEAGFVMKILKRYKDEERYEETTIEDVLEHTEGTGFWKKGTVLKMVESGQEVHTPFAVYKAG